MTSENALMQTLTYRRAENGVVFITINVRDRPVNVLTPELHREIGIVADRLAVDESAVGAVVHSGKSTFVAGGDLNRIVSYYDNQRTPEEAYLKSGVFSSSLRKLETCGKPVAASINGSALGGGLEIALACHHRVVADDANIALGFPEVTLGLLPGGGGTQRLPRLIGIEPALSLILSGRRIDPYEALDAGIVHQVATGTDPLKLAERWILEGHEASQPWDRKGFAIPGGSGLNDPRIGRLFQTLTARVSADYRHNFPAPIAALRCLFNGTTVSSMKTALEIETREFSALTRDPVARNMIRTLFINRGKTRRSEILSDPAVQTLKRRCEDAYALEGKMLVAEGAPVSLVENAAFAAGFPVAPLAMGTQTNSNPSTDRAQIDVTNIKQRLLCAQALAAAQCWEEGLIEPARADLASILAWDFPRYTGGVLSYADTMGLSAFIDLCDRSGSHTSKSLTPSPWLRDRALENDRIYPVAH